MAVQSRFWRWIIGIAFALTGLAIVFFVFVVPFLLSHFITHARSRPMDLKLTATPADYQIPYEAIQFTSTPSPNDAQPVELSGWYLPRDSAQGVIIYSHGLFRSRHEVLERATALWQAGYAGLLFDFRRHGKSGKGKTSIGFLERNDIRGAVNYIRDHIDPDIPIITYGISMGAAATLMAAAETEDVSAIIVDSSFRSFEHTVTHHLKLWLGLPRFPIGDMIILFTKNKVGFDSEDFDLVRAAQKIGNRPIMFIAGEKDRRMPVKMVKELYAASPSQQKKLMVIPGARHGKGFDVNPKVYTKSIINFLQAELHRLPTD